MLNKFIEGLSALQTKYGMGVVLLAFALNVAVYWGLGVLAIDVFSLTGNAIDYVVVIALAVGLTEFFFVARAIDATAGGTNVK